MFFWCKTKYKLCANLKLYNSIKNSLHVLLPHHKSSELTMKSQQNSILCGPSVFEYVRLVSKNLISISLISTYVLSLLVVQAVHRSTPFNSTATAESVPAPLKTSQVTIFR